VIIPPHRRRERGQTIILVAVAIVSLLAMAALAIDVVTLYVASSEIQRAADAAALAGAKGLADSGATTLQSSDPNLAAAEILAQNMANAEINAFLNSSSPTNLVAGATPTLAAGSPTFNWSPNNNPRVTVALQQTNLPTFFARILGRRTATVTASATAEAYNPANMATITPIAPKGVKPWLVANLDPTRIAGVPPAAFIDTTTWAVESGVIGEEFNLTSDCKGGASGCPPLNHNPLQANFATKQVDYVPATVTTNSQNVCSSLASCTQSINFPDYQQSIECSDMNSYSFLSCGGSGATNLNWDNSVDPGVGVTTSPTALGAECLIHASNTGAGQGQDLLFSPLPFPDGPPQITAQSPPQANNLVTTSNSIVTIPIISMCTGLNCFPPTGGAVTIVGFLQAFINWVEPNGDVNITVLNVAGCSSNSNAAPPVVGGMGTSPVPVRLITPP
jgi:Flp pilus assembly protein TadG